MWSHEQQHDIPNQTEAAQKKLDGYLTDPTNGKQVVKAVENDERAHKLIKAMGHSESRDRPKTEPDGTYKIRPGDNLTKIAQKFHTTVDILAKLNGLEGEKKNHIFAWKTLKVPQSGENKSSTENTKPADAAHATEKETTVNEPVKPVHIDKQEMKTIKATPIENTAVPQNTAETAKTDTKPAQVVPEQNKAPAQTSSIQNSGRVSGENANTANNTTRAPEKNTSSMEAKNQQSNDWTNTLPENWGENNQKTG